MKVGSFRRDARAMRDGEWVSPGPEFGEVQIRCKAMLPSYYDRINALTAREARRVGGENKIGMEFKNRIIVESLIEFCLLDIRGLEHDDGTPVPFPEFCDMIRSEDFSELATMSIVATSQVGRSNEGEISDAIKNSPKPLPTLSAGAAIPSG